MMILNNFHMNHKAKLIYFINVLSFILIIWTCLYNVENTVSKSLENRKKHDISLDIRGHRLLAKHEYQNDIPSSVLQNKVWYNRDNNKSLEGKENNNTYERLKKGYPNDVEAYLNSFHNRHSKKGALKKFDCYYEKKLFGSLDKIEKMVKQKNISNSRIKKIMYKKYAIPLIIITLIPLLTLAIPGIKVGRVHSRRGPLTCITDHKTLKTGKVKLYNHTKCKFELIIDDYLKYIFLFISTIIVVSIIIYTYIKILKYKRIKAGMLK